MKKCFKCNKIKSLDDFNRNSSEKDGYSTECKSCVNEYNRVYREQHKAEAQAYHKQYRVEDKDKLALKKREYVKQNKDLVSIRQHNWYEANKELTKQRTKKRKKDKPFEYQLYSNKRRAQKLNTTVENINIADIIDLYGNNCFYCGGKFEHIDHYMPLSKGGSHSIDNIRPACEKCNLMKSNKSPEEWAKLLEAIKKII